MNVTGIDYLKNVVCKFSKKLPKTKQLYFDR